MPLQIARTNEKVSQGFPQNTESIRTYYANALESTHQDEVTLYLPEQAETAAQQTASIVLDTIEDFLQHNDRNVTLYIPNHERLPASKPETLFQIIALLAQAFRTENRPEPELNAPRRILQSGSKPFQMREAEREMCYCAAPDVADYTDLQSLLDQPKTSFGSYLCQLIDAKKLEDAKVYKKANLERQVFNKIKNNENYHPKKPTVIALAMALELNLEETEELLKMAGMAFAPGETFDIFIRYCIERKIYNIIKDVNPLLFDFHQPQLGSSVQ